MTEKTQTQKSTKKSTKTSAKKSTTKKKVLQQVTESVENNINTTFKEKETDNMNTETINTINTTVENDSTNTTTVENNNVNTVTEEKENATMTNEAINNNNNTTNDNNNNNIADNNTSTTTATALKISGITQEQLFQILKNAGVDTTQINITAKAPKINDKLTYVDEEKTQAICAANSEHVFNINELDEATKIESMKSGLCPHCLNIMKQAAEIKAASGFRTRTVTNNQPSVEKPGFQIREILKANLNNINDELLAQLQDKNFSRSNFKLAYPMLLNITGMSAEEIKVARKDAKQHDRYSPQVYTINSQQFLLTNDLYGKNLEPIANFFNKLA